MTKKSDPYELDAVIQQASKWAVRFKLRHGAGIFGL